MISFDGRLLDCSVHPFDLPVGPWMLDLGEPVLDRIFFTAHVKHVSHVGGGRAVSIARRGR